MLIGILVLITALIFYALGYFSATHTSPKILQEKALELIKEKPPLGPLKRPTAEDLKRRDPHHKALVDEWKKVLPKEISHGT